MKEAPASQTHRSQLPRPSQLPSPLPPESRRQFVLPPSILNIPTDEATEATQRLERPTSIEMRSLSAQPTSLPIRRVRRGASLNGKKLQRLVSTRRSHEEKAATRVQAAARGKLIRTLKLTRLATAEQHAAITRLRARRHSAAPGGQALPAENTILREPRRPSVQTLKC